MTPIDLKFTVSRAVDGKRKLKWKDFTLEIVMTHSPGLGSALIKAQT